MTKAKGIVVVSIVLAFVLGLASLPAEAQKTEKMKQTLDMLDKDKKEYKDPVSAKEVLNAMVGSWDVQARIYVAADAEPLEMVGTAVTEPVMDGRYVQTNFKGEMMGDTVLGMGVDGFDPKTEKFVGVWMDTMDPGISKYEGTYDPETKALTSFSDEVDPESGKVRKVKGVTTFRTAVMYTYQSWVRNDEGEWEKQMEILYGKLK